MSTTWTVKRRKLFDRRSFVTFSFENPAYSKMWSLPCVLECARAARAHAQTTSYCKYGYAYAKHTKFISSFTSHLLPTCSKRHPCSFVESQGRHPSSVERTTNKADRNSIPPSLVQSLCGHCLELAASMDAKALIVVDLFSGWGSVKRALEQVCSPIPLFVYTNDIVRCRDCDIDVDVSVFKVEFLVRMAIVQFFEWAKARRLHQFEDVVSIPNDVVDFLESQEILVWIHVSFPCTTYSSMSGGTHRTKQSILPITPLAQSHDNMLKELCDDILKLCTCA
jgi:hypothetical protein